MGPCDHTSGYVSYTNPPSENVCPCCGYCRHCGRGGAYRPWYPYYPWYPSPYITWSGNDNNTTTNTWNDDAGPTS